MTKGLFTYVYGSKSHMNLAGKILLGVPMFPVLITICLFCDLLDLLFTKR